MNQKLTIGIIAVIIIAGIGLYSFANNEKGDATMTQEEKMQKEQMMKDDVMQKDEMMKDDASAMDKVEEKNDTMMKAGSYETYSPEKIARAEAGDVVLFFHASWCPSCRGLNSDIEKNVSAIPEGLSILKADYDKETELKKKYGITTQHTLVQVDKDGNLIKKWSGGSKLDAIVSEIM